jgi:hypothetical protein
MIFHCSDRRISVGVDVVDDSSLTLAIAACHPRDQFSRRRGFQIVNGRLDTDSNVHHFNGVVVGDSLNKSVFGPIRDAVRSMTDDERNDIEFLPDTILDAVDWDDPKAVIPLFSSSQRNLAAACCSGGVCDSPTSEVASTEVFESGPRVVGSPV